MKRDYDLIREILLKIESSSTPWFEGVMQVDGYHDGVVSHHISLLMDAGFVKAIELPDAHTEYGFLLQDAELKWEGHEFLENVRDPVIWRKTKAGATRVGTWSLPLLNELALGIIKKQVADLGIPFG